MENGRAIPLITGKVNEKEKFIINPEGARIINGIKGNVAVISIAGLYRYY